MKNKYFWEKLNDIHEKMNIENIDLWLIKSAETSIGGDPLLIEFLGNHIVSDTILLIPKDDKPSIIIADFDKEIAVEAGFDNIEVYNESYEEILIKYIEKHSIQTIAINNCEKFARLNGCKLSDYRKLKHLFNNHNIKFLSSENIGLTLGTINNKEIEHLQKAVKITENILESTFNQTKIGDNEQSFKNSILNKMDVFNVETSWDISYCPLVFFGDNTKTAGHISNTNKVLEEGDLILVDFGVKYKGYSADIQRMGFTFGSNVDTIPNIYNEAFHTVRDGVKLATQFITPSIKGSEIDTIVKKFISTKGFKTVSFCTGHPIGRYAHEVGVLIGPNIPRYKGATNLKFTDRQAFAIEPTIKEDDFTISVEENVYLENGIIKFLSNSQEDFYIIK